jgi:biofilm PGA synthesis N-glycosyltransferase PgaC
MIWAFVYIAVFCLLPFASIYGLYFLLVIKTSKTKEYLKSIDESLRENLSIQEVPGVSILVPAYNEEEVVTRKLRNIAALSYPNEKLEVILIDDCSTDKTADVAERAFKDLNLRGKIIHNEERMGVNASYNIGVAQCNSELILTTDADVTIDSEALIKGVRILAYFKKAGGVSGKMIPISSDATPAVNMEEPYRRFYDSMSTAESAIHSTFPGYTCFTLLRKSSFSSLPTRYGSSDGNISLATIRKGLRFLYVPSILFYEPISLKVSEQRRQKVRRAARLIQSILANKDMLFKKRYESFGRTIFPLRFAMMIVSPLLLFTGFAAIILATVFISMPLGLLLVFLLSLCTYLGAKINVYRLNLLSSFVMHHFYLLMGLFSSQKKVTVWRPAERSEMAS